MKNDFGLFYKAVEQLPAPPAKRTAQIAWLIRQEYPAVDLAFWDLSEFLPVFHNVRRQMVFIECDQMAHESVLRLLANAPETKDCRAYAGDRKPKTVNESWAMAKSTEEIRDSIVLVGRKDFKKDMLVPGFDGVFIPSVERRLADVLAYSLRGWLPIPPFEATDLLRSLILSGKIQLAELQGHMARRYLGKYLDYVVFYLVDSKELDASKVDPRYVESGRLYAQALKGAEGI